MNKEKAFWETLFNSESESSHWEITNNSDEETVRILYVPNDNYSMEDISIKVNYTTFKDLVDFVAKLSQPAEVKTLLTKK